ncbi:MAG: c-type cytochrome domain-containing protein [Panacibacter sp.]
MKNTILLFVAIAGLLFSCQHQVSGPGNPNGGGGTDTTGNGGGGTGTDSLVCFEGDVLPIFVSSCAIEGCHDSKSKAEGYVFDNFQNITKKGIIPEFPGNSKVFEEIASGEMPPGGALSQAQLSIISKWIEQGAKNTTNCNTCDSSVFTYSAAISVTMSTNCTGCHSTNNASGGVDLSTYSGVKTVALNGRLIGAVTQATGYVAMPPGGMLSDCDIAQIKKWVAAGALNN